MEPVLIEIAMPDDESHDDSLGLILATAEFLARITGLNVSVSDGMGNTEDF